VVDPINTVINTPVANSEVINIGPDDEFITINELALKIARIMSFDLNPIYMPGRPQEVQFANCSANKARKLLKYSPKVGLNEGLTELVNWIVKSGVKPFDYHLPIEINNSSTPKTWTQKLI
jgi:UDP-glucose 4-epimerase